MVIRKVLASLAAAGLVVASTGASAATAQRSASPVAGADSLHGGWGWILALLIVIGVIAVIASDNNEDLPHSP